MMHTDIPVSLVSAFVLLVLVAVFSAILFRRIRIPYTIGLVAVGLLLYRLGGVCPRLALLRHIHLTPNFTLYVLLPTLIFDAAINLPVRRLFRDIVPILLLAVPGVLVATAATGLIVWWATPLGLGAAMLFGALVSTTDPVAVIALFNEIGAPKRLAVLVDGESLFNDATAIAAFDIVAAVVAAGLLLPDPLQAWNASSLLAIPPRFLWVFFGGGAVGAAVGFVMMQLLRWTGRDPLVEIALTTVVAYAAFILANYVLGFSGVMAACGAGLVVKRFAKTRLSPETSRYLHQFWGFAAFMANSMIFLLLGLTESFLSASHHPFLDISCSILVAIAAMLATRALILAGTALLYNPFARRPLTRPLLAAMFWSGLRGALPIALAMSIAPIGAAGGLVTPAERQLVIQMTLGVILFTLLVQGTTVSPLMRLLRLARPSDPAPPAKN